MEKRYQNIDSLNLFSRTSTFNQKFKKRIYTYRSLLETAYYLKTWKDIAINYFIIQIFIEFKRKKLHFLLLIKNIDIYLKTQYFPLISFKPEIFNA